MKEKNIRQHWLGEKRGKSALLNFWNLIGVLYLFWAFMLSFPAFATLFVRQNYKTMLKKIEKIIIQCFLLVTSITTILLIRYIGWCDEEFYDNLYFDYSGAYIAVVMFFNILLQAITHFILVILNIVSYIKTKELHQKHKIFVFLLLILFGFMWIVFMSIFNNNGHCDIIWGPADSGLVFTGIASSIVNLLYLKILRSKITTT